METALFSGIHGVWHLAHIALFESQVETPVLDSLIRWVNLNHSEKMQREFQALVGKTVFAKDVLFWAMAKRLVCRGHFKAAISLFQSNEQFRKELSSNDFIGSKTAVKALSILFDTMPSSKTSVSTRDFKEAWTKWNEECNFIYSGGEMSAFNLEVSEASHFGDLFAILSGDELAILKSSETWIEALLALNLFTDPSILARNLPDFLPVISQRFEPSNVLDHIQFSILRNDVPSIIQYSSNYDCWLVTHLVDLLSKSGLVSTDIQRRLAKEECTIQQWFRLNYADLLISNQVHIRTALELLMHSGPMGRSVCASYLPHIELLEDGLRQSVFKFCELHDFPKELKSIFKSLANASLANGDFVAALLLFGKAQDQPSVNNIVDKLMRAYIQTGDRGYEQIVDQIVGGEELNATMSTSLSFLCNYREFQKLYDAGRFQEAGNLLILLLTSGATPRSFWMPLLLDAVPMLECKTLVFGKHDTLELMRVAQELDFVDTKASAATELDVVRLALCRNLARSYNAC